MSNTVGHVVFALAHAIPRPTSRAQLSNPNAPDTLNPIQVHKPINLADRQSKPIR